ncbi:hypothetical protein [uncultured Endozoicomonas sp.]|uniref:hypothetical protein n=1 Tax=uncultured Endozoicomonas sp. TaxID=432652 RepID=UPI0026245637|nr:hypothetical protein [uncultured Endozoicomonas sp.]
MLVKLSYQHSRSISAALLAVMILSVLQFCMMSMAQGQTMSHGNNHQQSASHHEMMAEMVHEVVLAGDVHDCCISDSSLSHTVGDREMACPDCEDSDPALHLSSLSDLKPLYALLYVVVQEALNHATQTRTWQVFTEPNILSSQPEIYLVKASFLE